MTAIIAVQGHMSTDAGTRRSRMPHCSGHRHLILLCPGDKRGAHVGWRHHRATGRAQRPRRLASSERIIALIGPTATGVIDRRRDADARSAPSPRACARPSRRTRRAAPSLAVGLAHDPPQEAQDRRRQPVVAFGQRWDWSGRRRTGTGSDRWCRSTGSRASAAGRRASRRAPAPRASRRSGSLYGSSFLRSASQARWLLDQLPRPASNSQGSDTIGNMTSRSRPAAASSSARACAFISASRSSASRSARQPIGRVFLAIFVGVRR